MEGDLINLNESARKSSVNEAKDLIVAANLGKGEIKSLLDLSDVLGNAPDTNCSSTPKCKEKCLLNDAEALMSPFGYPTSGSSLGVKLDITVNSNQIELISPFCHSKINGAQNFNIELLTYSDPSKLLSPFGYPAKVRSKSVALECNKQTQVPTGELLQVQVQPKLPDDMFDVAVLEKNQIKITKDSKNQCEKESKLLIPSIPSIGSGESMISSDGTINKAFMELSSNVETEDLYPSPNDSVFEEAQALSEKFSKMALNAPISPFEGIDNEDASIVYNCPDLDDVDIENVEWLSSHEEFKKLLDCYAKENEYESRQKEINGMCQNSSSNLASSEVKGSCQVNGSGTSGSASSISSLSPLPLSTHRLDRMRLKASEAIGAPLNLAPLKTNASSRSSALPAKSGPMKAFIPFGQIVKSKLSPVLGTSSKSRGTPQLKIIESSPVIKEGNSCIGMMSSTPKTNKPNVSSGSGKPVTAIRKGLTGSNQKVIGVNKVHSEVSSTPTRPRTSSFGRVQETGKPATINKFNVQHNTKKLPSPSPHLSKRSSVDSPVVKSSVVRSSSTGHLPLTPSTRKVNSSPQFQQFQSTLKRTNSLSAKLSHHSPSRPFAATSVNSPAKKSTPLDKMMMKFRRNSVSRGMKENISPVKN